MIMTTIHCLRGGHFLMRMASMIFVAAMTMALVAPATWAQDQPPGKKADLALDKLTAEATSGDVDAQMELAHRYARGIGLEADFAKANGWYRKAADQGNAKGAYCLGLAYFHGIGMEKDFTKAAQWFRKAADAGFAPGESALGGMYMKGQGMAKDYK
jgi:TPR repeat protein